MSIREMAYNVIDSMTEEQLNAFLMLFGRYKEPNEETLKALAEVEDMKKNPDNYKSYDNADDTDEGLTEMKYIIKPTSQFKKDLKKMEKQHKDLSLLTEIINNLANAVPLPEKNKDHELSGNFKGCRECHIQPDWLLIYEINNNELILYLTRTGSHSDLF